MLEYINIIAALPHERKIDILIMEMQEVKFGACRSF